MVWSQRYGALLVLFAAACREPARPPPVGVPEAPAARPSPSAAEPSAAPATPSGTPAKPAFPLEVASLASTAARVEVCRTSCGFRQSDLRWPEHVQLFRFQGKGTASIPGGQRDAFVLVLERSAVLKTASGATSVGAWSVARVADEVIQIEGEDEAVILVALATDKTSLQEAVKHPPAAGSASPAAASVKPPGVVDLRAAPELVWAGGKSGARIAFENGRSSFGLIMMSAEGEVPEHEHAEAVEVLFGLTGAKWLYVAPKPAQPVDPLQQVQGILVEPGAFARVPRAHRHLGARFGGDAGKAPFVAVQMYVPPGPEQRFRALAEKERAAAGSR